MTEKQATQEIGMAISQEKRGDEVFWSANKVPPLENELVGIFVEHGDGSYAPIEGYFKRFIVHGRNDFYFKPFTSDGRPISLGDCGGVEWCRLKPNF